MCEARTPLGTSQVRASANFYWLTPPRVPVGRGGYPQSNKLHFQFYLYVYEFGTYWSLNAREIKLLFLVIILSEILSWFHQTECFLLLRHSTNIPEVLF